MKTKTFEAKTMKEALELVKREMGSEALVVSAEKSKSFMGKSSVALTAAVLPSKEPKPPAPKETEAVKPSAPKETRGPLSAVPSSIRYIDMIDEGSTPLKAKKASPNFSASPHRPQPSPLRTVYGEKISPIRLHPGAELGVDFEMSTHYKTLVDAGVEKKSATRLLKSAKHKLGGENSEQWKNSEVVQGVIAREILNKVKVISQPYQNSVHLFVGGSGHGRSTALIKFAADIVVHKKNKVLIAEVKKDGPSKLDVYANILNCSYQRINDPSSWNQVLKSKNRELFDYLLVYLPGLSLKTREEHDFLRSLMPPLRVPTSTHFVQSALWREHEISRLLDRYLSFGVTDLIFTRLDECVTHGVLWNIQETYNLPFHSFSVGPNLPTDYEFATKERVLDLLFRITSREDTNQDKKAKYESENLEESLV